MQININNTLINNDFESIDFKNLSIGQQIFVLKQKKFYDDKNNESIYNDITTYYLRNKPASEIYVFDKIDFNINVYDSYDNCYMDAKTNNDEKFYIMLNKDKVEIDSIYEQEDIDLFAEEHVLNKFKTINNREYFANKYTIQDYMESKTESDNYLKNIIDYFCTINFDNFILAFNINYEFCEDRYLYNNDVSFYIIDERFEKFSEVHLNNKQINNLICLLQNNFLSSDYERCIDHLKTIQYSITGIRKDITQRNIFAKTFGTIDFNNKTIYTIIDNFTKCLLTEKQYNLKAYFADFNNGQESSVNIEYDNDYYDTEFTKVYKLFKRKSKSIAMMLTKKSIINIYSGEVIHDRFHKTYEDYEYLVIENVDTGLKTVFEKIDNMFITVDWIYKTPILDEIYNRIKLANTLSE